jgi:hypothetical protein
LSTRSIPTQSRFVSMVLGAGRPLIPLMARRRAAHQVPQAASTAVRPQAAGPLEPVIRNLSETLTDAFAADGAVDFAAFASRRPARSS